ncbi:carbonic anhydrase [Suillus ampliporus]|nr:carbonic anhydrase [Suillus ampliporus]
MSRSNAAQALIKANKEWAQGVIEQIPDFFKRLAATTQEPKILWIGCTDSRVPASVVTASMPGDICTHTNIANQFHVDDDNAQAVLDFAVNTLGVEHVVLVGHNICEGAQAAIEAAVYPDVPQPDDPLTRWLTPLTELVRTLDLSGLSFSEATEKVVEANIVMQVDNICKSDTIVASWADPRAKKVIVHGWLYDLATGRIKELFSRHPPSCS